MRKQDVWGMAAILGLGVAVSSTAVAGDEPSGKPSRSWLGKFFAPPIDTIEETQEAVNRKKKVEEEPIDNSVQKEAERMKVMRQAMDDYQRREKVLDRLMMLAHESDDPALSKRIESLYERAWNVYKRKAGSPPVTANARTKTEDALPGRGENP